MKTVAEIAAIVAGVNFRDWKFVVEMDDTRPLLVIEFEAVCVNTGVLKIQRSRKWLLSPHMGDGEILQTAFLAMLTAIEHEAREDFTWKGLPIFGPHFDPRALHAVAQAGHTEHR